MIRIGLCPCLGRNGPNDEYFTLEDGKTLKAFADATPWVCSLHYWSINDDSGKRRRRNANTAPDPQAQPPQPWDFASLFKDFTKP